MQLFAKLLPGRGPVRANAFADLCDMALEVQFVLLKPGDIKLLARGTALELAGDVLLVVTHDPGFVVSRWKMH